MESGPDCLAVRLANPHNRGGHVAGVPEPAVSRGLGERTIRKVMNIYAQQTDICGLEEGEESQLLCWGIGSANLRYCLPSTTDIRAVDDPTERLGSLWLPQSSRVRLRTATASRTVIW